MPRQVNIHYAKTHLSKLLEAVEGGEEIILARAGTPVARLAALEEAPSRLRWMGVDADKVSIAEDFDAPLPEDILRDFES